ncbi:hypothetical protein NP233_g4973 [Leucocoprinus birnbaumii]|uniref:GST N-terminal domain-containing protein n=1 Tax=Leucocoprinus birnbaumii TaxID=56174 RepID=A0AAD5VTU1_9AGAR|nr:hypothetical protein NP233_g4973 [Leucocoprinus birnbaumii]
MSTRPPAHEQYHSAKDHAYDIQAIFRHLIDEIKRFDLSWNDEEDAFFKHEFLRILHSDIVTAGTWYQCRKPLFEEGDSRTPEVVDDTRWWSVECPDKWDGNVVEKAICTMKKELAILPSRLYHLGTVPKGTSEPTHAVPEGSSKRTTKGKKSEARSRGSRPIEIPPFPATLEEILQEVEALKASDPTFSTKPRVRPVLPPGFGDDLLKKAKALESSSKAAEEIPAPRPKRHAMRKKVALGEGTRQKFERNYTAVGPITADTPRYQPPPMHPPVTLPQKPGKRSARIMLVPEVSSEESWAGMGSGASSLASSSQSQERNHISQESDVGSSSNMRGLSRPVAADKEDRRGVGAEDIVDESSQSQKRGHDDDDDDDEEDETERIVARADLKEEATEEHINVHGRLERQTPRSSSDNMITLYDLAAKQPGKTWSPNPWKLRYVLNMKKLPYKTLYFDYPDLEAAEVAAGIPHYTIRPNGKPLYTSPAIVDDSTGAKLPDSYKIAEYLDKAYPDTPKAFPAGSEALQAAFFDNFNELTSPLWPIIMPKVPGILNPPAAEYFFRTRSETFGKPLDQIAPVGDERVAAWAKLKAGFDKLDGWFAKSGGPYFMGETASFADFIAGSLLQAMRICFGEESEEWKDVVSWNNGRWATLLKDLEKYASEEQ